MLAKIKKNYFILISTVLFLYFFLNLLDGDRGLISLLKKENLLLTDNLDLDYIEILIRQKFLFGKEGEKIYLIKNNEN